MAIELALKVDGSYEQIVLSALGENNEDFIKRLSSPLAGRIYFDAATSQDAHSTVKARKHRHTVESHENTPFPYVKPADDRNATCKLQNGRKIC